MVRVVHIIESLHGGGVEKLLEVTLPRLRDVGVEPALLYLVDVEDKWRDDPTHCLAGLKRAGIPTRCLRPGEVGGFRFFRRTRVQRQTDIETAAEFLTEFGATVMHAHLHAAYLFVRELSRSLRTPYFVTDHCANDIWQLDRTLRGRLNRRMILASYRQAQGVICVSKACEAYLRKDLGQNHNRYELLYNAIGDEFWTPKLAQPAATFDVLMCGRLLKQKNYLFALEVFRELKGRMGGLRVGIVGTGPLESVIRQSIQDRGLSGHVTLLGRKTSDEIRDLMDGSRCFFMPSIAEGLGIAAVEALAREMPVVLSDALPFRMDLSSFGGVRIVDIGSVKPSVEALAESIGEARVKRPQLKTMFGMDAYVRHQAELYRRAGPLESHGS